MRRFQKKDLFTIPNIIGYVRILLIPVFCWLYVTADCAADYMWATGVVLFSSFTDLFDGLIARKFNQVTEIGKVLDPVADKLTHAALAICLAVRYPQMWVLIVLMVVKEGYMGLMGLHFLKKGKMLNGAMWYGKVCTATLFAGMFLLFLVYDMPSVAVNTIIGIMMAVMAAALVMYVGRFRKMEKECAQTR